METNGEAAVLGDERKRLMALERERRRYALSGALLPGKLRNELTRPMGRGERRTIAGGRECGRNDPCPCGSGRKYKACCLPAGRRFIRPMELKHAPK